MMFAIAESSSGAASASVTNPAITAGVAGRISIPPRIVELVQPVPEPGRDAEVAAAAPDRPEQIRVCLGIDVQQLAVGRDELGGEQVVDREAVLADEEPDAASEREPADPDRGGVAETRRQSVSAGRCGVLAGGQPGLRPGRPCLGRRSPALFICERSRTIPPSDTPCPARLWPPLRTASSRPVSRASETTAATSAASVGRTIAAGRRSTPR